MKKCDSCGKTYQESKDLFCPHCGAIATKKRSNNSYDSVSSSRWIRNDVYGEKRNSDRLNTESERDTSRGYSGMNDGNGTHKSSAESYAESRRYAADKNPDTGTEINLPKMPRSTGQANKGVKTGLVIFCVIIAVNILITMINKVEDSFDDYTFEDVSTADVKEYIVYSKTDAVFGNAFIKSEFEDDKNEEVNISFMPKDLFVMNSPDGEVISSLAKNIKKVNLVFAEAQCDDVYDAGFNIDDITGFSNGYDNTKTIECSINEKGGFSAKLPYEDGMVIFPSHFTIVCDKGEFTVSLPYQAFTIESDGFVTSYNVIDDGDDETPVEFSEWGIDDEYSGEWAERYDFPS